MASAALGAAALSFAIDDAAAVPTAALPRPSASSPAASHRLADNQGTTPAPTASAARVAVEHRRLNLRAGGSALVRGAVRPAARGLSVVLQAQRGGRWRTLDRARTDARGRYVLRDRLARPLSTRVRVRVSGGGRVLRRSLGRLNVYRTASASWYGPGLYGQRTGCGGTLGAGRLGVAHKTLPCGSRVTLRHRGRTVRVRVIDRGPYMGGREYDLTAPTARRLRFEGHGTILTTR